jgi:hypothetical protein
MFGVKAALPGDSSMIDSFRQQCHADAGQWLEELAAALNGFFFGPLQESQGAKRVAWST